MKYIVWIFRIVVGCLFIFSGLIKAIDPMGLSNKMLEFFEVWGTTWAAPYALTLSVMMIAFEIIAGVGLLLGAAFRVFSFLLLLLTTFFTFLTAYVYLSGKIKDCGCFGDCIKISNAETFWKDVILLILVLILFIFRKKVPQLFKGYPTAALMILTTFFAFGIQWWALEHLPLVDCMPYKVGANIPEKMKAPEGATPDVVESVFIYKRGGEQKEFTMETLSEIDSTWTFVDRKDKLIKKGNYKEPEIKDFSITSLDGTDYTEQVLTTPGYTFLLFVKDPVKAREDNTDRLRSLMVQANQLNIPFYVLSSGSIEETNKFKEDRKLYAAEYTQVDGTASKTAMRANPGLMLLKQGVVEGKWSFRDYPDSIRLEGERLIISK